MCVFLCSGGDVCDVSACLRSVCDVHRASISWPVPTASISVVFLLHAVSTLIWGGDL